MKSIKESLDAEKEQKVKLEKVRCVCNCKQSSIITPSYIFCHCWADPNKKGLCVIFLRDRFSLMFYIHSEVKVVTLKCLTREIERKSR